MNLVFDGGYGSLKAFSIPSCLIRSCPISSSSLIALDLRSLLKHKKKSSKCHVAVLECILVIAFRLTIMTTKIRYVFAYIKRSITVSCRGDVPIQIHVL